MNGYKENIIKRIMTNIKNMKKSAKITVITALILIIVLIIGILVSVFINEEKKQKYVLYNGENLNENKYPGYKELIDKLKETHPNWTFTLFYTKLDWNEVIKMEGHDDNRTNPLNLIPDSDDYKD